ncbi:DUF3616 domain-containing protein [Polaromonas glacialis]|uniref:DUF3616 domain-containing protein n=1 Tax=Polaromonas glacialis TaxID=866564 RepID=UPI000496B155|nr:DUF3616 domain-containing protein [Polaromonas glacialis]
MFLPLTGLYEPSAIQQLPDGRFLALEDEKGHSFSLLTLNADGTVKHKPLGPGWFQGGAAIWSLDDLEGLALDSLGYLYAITSHSRDDDGDEEKDRNKLARFRIEADRLVDCVVVGGLKDALAAAHPVLAAAAEIKDVKTSGGFNIEALEITPDRQRLLVGFRSPLQGRHALIASVENPAAIFEADAAPQVSGTLQTLDLDGQGIRGMSYIAPLNGYLVISGPVSREGTFGLWFWSGQSGAPARRVTVPGLPGFGNAEGICVAVVQGVPKIVIVSDDGDRKKGRCAHFLLLDPGTLQIAP